VGALTEDDRGALDHRFGRNFLSVDSSNRLVFAATMMNLSLGVLPGKYPRGLIVRSDMPVSGKRACCAGSTRKQVSSASAEVESAVDAPTSTAAATGNITPLWGNANESKEEDTNAFVIVRRVTDMIIRSWVNSGEENVMDMIEGGEEPSVTSIYASEHVSTDVHVDKRKQVHAMLEDWDKFA
jgi:hypothetical protein